MAIRQELAANFAKILLPEGFGALPSSSTQRVVALHAQWAITGSPSTLGSQAVNIENYVFWKLHGWIDDVWERYRTAQGMAVLRQWILDGAKFDTSTEQ